MTTFALADGPLGLEAQHVWNGVYGLNSQTTWPRAKLTKITGLHSLGDVDDNRQPNSGRDGEHVYPSHRRGKTVVYEGVLLAKTLPSLRASATAMRAAFWSSAEGSMIITPFSGPAHTFAARPLALDLDDEQVASPQSSPGPYQRTFQLTLRLSDSRLYENLVHNFTGTDGGSNAAFIGGSVDTPPSFNIFGPIAGTVGIHNSSTGQYLVFTDISIASGDYMVVDFSRRFAYASDGAAVLEDLTGHLSVSNSNWWDEGAPGLIPQTTPTVYCDGGAWQMYWRNANA